MKRNMVADGTSSTDQGGDFVFQIQVGMDHEALQVAAHHFELAMFRQQGTTAKITDWGGDYPIQADFVGNPKTREESAVSRHQQRTTSIEQSKQFGSGGRRMNCSFLPSGYAVCCMLYCTFFVFCLFANFPCYHVRYIKQQEFSAEDRSDRDTRTRGAAFELVMDHLDS